MSGVDVRSKALTQGDIMHTIPDTIPANVTIGALYRFPGDEWNSYDLTLELHGRSYAVGQLTVYDDSVRGSMVLSAADLRTVAQRKAWDAITLAYGYPQLEAWEPPHRFVAA